MPSKRIIMPAQCSSSSLRPVSSPKRPDARIQQCQESSSQPPAWKSIGVIRYDRQQSRLLLRKPQPMKRPRRTEPQSSWTHVPLPCTARTASTSLGSRSSGYGTASPLTSKSTALSTATISSIVSSALAVHEGARSMSQQCICITIRTNNNCASARSNSYETPASEVTLTMSCGDSDRHSAATIMAAALQSTTASDKALRVPEGGTAHAGGGFQMSRGATSDSEVKEAATVDAASRPSSGAGGNHKFKVRTARVRRFLSRLRCGLIELLTGCLSCGVREQHGADLGAV